MEPLLKCGDERITPGFDLIFHGEDVLPPAALLGLGLADVVLQALGVFHAQRHARLIDEYNAGSQNIEAFFEDLKRFAQALSKEDQRGIAEGLTEEELALFDILTKPEPVLTKAEEAPVSESVKRRASRSTP